MLLLLILLFGAYCQAEVYYVTTNGEDCSNCHPLSYYTTLSQWSPNVTLIFLKGEHKLKDNPLIMAGLESVTLQGPPQHNRSLGDATISCENINEPNAIVIANISSTVHIERLTMDCHNTMLFENTAILVVTDVQAQSIQVSGNNLPTKLNISRCMFIIQHNTTSHNAVDIFGANTVIVKDTVVANELGSGLALHHNGDHMLLDNVTIENCSKQGMYLGWNGDNISLKSIKLNNITNEGLFMIYNGNNINFKDIIITNTKIGLFVLSNGNHVSLSGVRVVNSSGMGYFMASNGDYISLNKIYITNTNGKACDIERNGNNISLADITVANSKGISMERNGNNITLVNILVFNNSVSGLRLNNNGFFISLTNVTCSYTQGTGLTLERNNHSIKLNNIQLISNNIGLVVNENGHNALINNVIAENNLWKGLDVSSNGNNVMLTNITVSNSSYAGLHVSGNWNGLTLSNIKVTNSDNIGLYVAYNGNSITLYNITMNNTDIGIYAYKNGRNLLIKNIRIYNSHDKNLVVSNNNDNLTLEDIVLKRSKNNLLVSLNRNMIWLINVYVANAKFIAVKVCQNGNSIYLSNVTVENTTNGIQIENNGNDIELFNIVAKNSNISGIGLINNGNSIGLYSVTSIYSNGKGLELLNNKDTITLNDIILTNNAGGGLYLEYNGKDIEINNMIVANNSIGGVTMAYNRYNIKISNLSVINNTDTGIYADGDSDITFTGQPSTLIHNSSPGNGGGMWIGKDIVILGEAMVSFYNNTARGVGGALYADTKSKKTNQKIYTGLLEYCTFESFKPKFSKNIAKLGGNDIYGGKYSGCTSVYSNLPQPLLSNFLDAINCTKNTYIFRNFPTPISSHVTSSPIGVCLCTSNSVIDCTNRSINRELYSGQSITLPIITVGVCGGISPGEIVTNNINAGVQVILNDTNQETLKQCKNFTYQLFQQSVSDSREIFKLQHKLVPDKETNFLSHSELTVNITFLPCPLGLDLEAKRCHCNDIIGEINGTECNVDWMPYPIKRHGSNWLHYSQEYNCIVAHSTCPFDYCDTSTLYLNLNDSDIQCTSNRSGILCGQCQTGLSLMLGSNKCSSCTNKYPSLLIAFVAAGVVLVAFLMVCNLTVSVGSINGLLFYANIVKLNQIVLFPDGTSIPVLSQFIAWLNLDLGIQTCFFNGLDGYWKTWLQFVFPLYIWLLIGFLIIGSHYSGRLSRLCGNNAVPVLATLVLMSYTKLLGTITNVLMRDTVDCESTAVWSVWSIDGNIGYLSGKHIPLFVVALLFLFIGLVYTGLVFSAQWLQRYSGKCCRSSRDPVVKMKPFIDAYTGPYKDKYRFWTGLLLIVRLILTPVFSYTTGSLSIVNNYIIALIAFIIMIFMRSVYRKKHINVLEYFYFLNLSVLSLLSAVCNDYGLSVHSITIITGVSVSLAMAVFLATVVAHIYIMFFGSKKLLHRGNDTSIHLTNIAMQREHITDEGSPARLIMRRESLIFDYEP